MPRSLLSSLFAKSLDIYALLFAKKIFARLNKMLFLVGARGMGILNYRTLYLSGEEPFLKNFLACYDSEEYIVIDVGANEGQFASCVLGHTRAINVLSYEPNPHACRKLKSCLTFDIQRHKLVEKGASNCISEAVIYDYGLGLGTAHASMYIEVITDIHHSQSVISEKINLTTIDHDLAHLNARIAILKIDTEGHEKAVLEGARNILATNPPISILVEFNEMNAISGTHFRDILNLIGADYEPYRLLPGGSLLSLENLSPFFTEIYAYQNLVFLRKM